MNSSIRLLLVSLLTLSATAYGKRCSHHLPENDRKASQFLDRVVITEKENGKFIWLEERITFVKSENSYVWQDNCVVKNGQYFAELRYDGAGGKGLAVRGQILYKNDSGSSIVVKELGKREYGGYSQWFKDAYQIVKADAEEREPLSDSSNPNKENLSQGAIPGAPLGTDTNKDNATASVTNNPDGSNTTETTNPDGSITVQKTNADGVLISATTKSTDASGVVTEESTDANGVSTTIKKGSDGKLISETVKSTDADGMTTTRVTDSEGNVRDDTIFTGDPSTSPEVRSNAASGRVSDVKNPALDELSKKRETLEVDLDNPADDTTSQMYGESISKYKANLIASEDEICNSKPAGDERDKCKLSAKGEAEKKYNETGYDAKFAEIQKKEEEGSEGSLELSEAQKKQKEKMYEIGKLEDINCLSYFEQYKSEIQEHNNVGEIVGRRVPASQLPKSFDQPSSCNDKNYFKKKFYGNTLTITGALSEKGIALACANMANYSGPVVNIKDGSELEGGYSCQSILDARENECVDKQDEQSEGLLSDSDSDKVVKAFGEVAILKNDLMQAIDEMKLNPEGENPVVSGSLMEFEKRLKSIERRLNLPGTTPEGLTSANESNYKISGRTPEQLKQRAKDRMAVTLNGLREHLSTSFANVEAAGKNFKFRNKKVCREVLFDEYNGCLGLERKFSGDRNEDYYSVYFSKSQMLDVKEMIYNTNGAVASPTDFFGGSEYHGDMYTKAYPACSGSECKENQDLLNNKLSSSFQELYGECASIKKSIKVHEDGIQTEFSGPEEYTSFDGRFRCVNKEAWTLDFHSCKRLVNFYDGAALGGVAMQAVNTGIQASRNNRIQQDALNETINGGDQLNAGLNAQAKALTAKEQAETRKAVFSGAKVATLTSMLLAYKTPKRFTRRCKAGIDEDHGIDGSHYCIVESVWDQNPEIKLSEMFPNQKVREAMWGVVVQAGVETTLAIMAATQASKQRADVNGYKKMFEEQKDESSTEEVAVGLDYCKYNPASPQCQKRGPRVSSGGNFGYGNIGLQGQGQNLAISDKEDSFGDYKDDAIADGSSDAIDDLGNIIDNDDIGSFGNDFNAPGAGGTTKGGALGGGGGGGGGSGGGGGGGGSAPAKAKTGQAKYAVTSKTGNYGKRGRDIKYSGGGSANSKKKTSNPFSKMFGSNSSRKIASDVKDIAPAHSGLFDKISKRYERVATDKRLLDLSNVKK